MPSKWPGNQGKRGQTPAALTPIMPDSVWRPAEMLANRFIDRIRRGIPVKNSLMERFTEVLREGESKKSGNES